MSKLLTMQDNLLKASAAELLRTQNYGFQQIKKLYNRGFTSEPKVKIPKTVALFTKCKREKITSDFY